MYIKAVLRVCDIVSASVNTDVHALSKWGEYWGREETRQT